MPHFAPFLALCLFTGLLPCQRPIGLGADLEALLEGVHRVAAPGSPGLVSVFGPHAFAVVAGATGKQQRGAVVAASRLGKGRLVAFGHGGYFASKVLGSLDTGRLMAGCVRWAAGGKPRPSVATWRQEELRGWLGAEGFAVKALSRPEAARAEADVVLLSMHGLGLEQERALAAFVAQGGGLITAETPWGWLQLNPGKTLQADLASNRLLMPAGLAFADGIAGKTTEGGYEVAGGPDRLINASLGLDLLEAQAAGLARPVASDLRQAGVSLGAAIRALPGVDSVLLPRLRKLAVGAGPVVPAPDRPLGMDHALGRVLLTLELEGLRSLPPESIPVHPAAARFPGAVPEGALRVRRTLAIDTGRPGWHSTGLYAPAGEVVEILAPGAAEGLSVRIGAHKDLLWHHEKWARVPEITGEWPLEGVRTRVASPFGGLLYLVVAPGLAKRTVQIQVFGAVEAPLFVQGRTGTEEWREHVRTLPAPWAELASNKVVLTVPSKHIRNLEDPAALMELWDRVLDACAQLSVRPYDRLRPERIVSDVQISAGYMHAGYPIMTHLDAAARMVDRTEILGGEWGLFHELGHNHQSADWTFQGTGEVTVNLFTLYVFEKICGKKPAQARDSLAPARRAATLRDYLAKPDFERWKRDPFLALIMYVELQEAFGWDAFIRVFAEYRDLAQTERPRADNEKRDQWLVRFSRAVGRNLGPFFEAWGVPTSAKARDEVAALPGWMPEEWPE